MPVGLEGRERQDHGTVRDENMIGMDLLMRNMYILRPSHIVVPRFRRSNCAVAEVILLGVSEDLFFLALRERRHPHWRGSVSDWPLFWKRCAICHAGAFSVAGRAARPLPSGLHASALFSGLGSHLDSLSHLHICRRLQHDEAWRRAPGSHSLGAVAHNWHDDCKLGRLRL